MKHEVRYRLEIDYLSTDYEEWVMQTSSPIYTKADGLKQYKKATKQFCIDDPEKPARVHLWKYNYIGSVFAPITIAKNY